MIGNELKLSLGWVLFGTEQILRASVLLLYLLVGTRTVIGQFSGRYSSVRPAKI